ncbi:MAG: glycosyltransferase family 39 protein [Anaerolineae bacterium]
MTRYPCPPSHSPRSPLSAPRLTLSALLLLGFWLRLAYLRGGLYFFDEFFSMLAAQMTVERGVPILPSGLFYDHGLLLSYLTAPLLALAGFKEEIARWPVLLISVFTIAAAYTCGRRLFDSPLAGLLAAGLVTLDELAIIWGTRARMYSLAYLFVLLSLTWLLSGTLQRPGARLRYLGLAAVAAMLLSHSITFLFLPPLAALIVLFTGLYRREWLRQPKLWQEVIVAGVIVGLVLVIVKLGQTGSTLTVHERLAAAPPPLGIEFLRGLVDPGLEWSRFDNLTGFFETPAYEWLRPVISLALLLALYRVVRRQVTFVEAALFFLALLVGLMIFELGSLLSDAWSKSRYVFILALPAYTLLSAGSLAYVGQTMVSAIKLFWPIGRLEGWKIGKFSILPTFLALIGLILIAYQLGPTAWNLTRAQSTGDYHTAFAYVRANWQSGDRVMTVQPAAAYLYLWRNDYYANQVTALVFESEGEENTPLDRYTGSPLVDSVERLNEVLASGQRIWFVVDALRLYERFEPLFTQQIFAQMDLAERTGNTYVFLSRPYPVPLPAQPATRLEANFGNVIRLDGYSFDLQRITPDGTLPVALYWRPLGTPSRPFKLFAQVRNRQGQIITQADHFLLEDLLTLDAWQTLQQQGEWLRDTADLRLPQPLPAENGPYRLYVGFYDPTTLQRVPVNNDASGENAVVIELK